MLYNLCQLHVTLLGKRSQYCFQTEITSPGYMLERPEALDFSPGFKCFESGCNKVYLRSLVILDDNNLVHTKTFSILSSLLKFFSPCSQELVLFSS